MGATKPTNARAAKPARQGGPTKPARRRAASAPTTLLALIVVFASITLIGVVLGDLDDQMAINYCREVR